jgi:UDP-N-acetylmuramoyl-tripeptide--D-alanyl-D-alanine ligase
MTTNLYKKYLACDGRIAIATKLVQAGGIFVAVGQRDDKGRHRGNLWARKAVEELGAAYAIINDSDLYASLGGDERYILVEDGETTLQNLAQIHRRALNIPIIAIGGSNGKTTLKELLAGVLNRKYSVFATEGNLNNHLGVPLTLLRLRSTHQIAIVEIGANHLDETAFLAQLAEPNFGVVTNCGKDHLGEYGSFENVVRGNAELYDYLAANEATAFVCTDDPILLDISNRVKNRIFYGSQTPISASVTNSPLLGVDLTIEAEKYGLQTHLFGAFWRDAVVAAAAIGRYFLIDNEDIVSAIGGYVPASLRSQQIIWRDTPTLLDCYNANPSSVSAFLQAVADDKTAAQKIVVLGEMLELGIYEQEEHILLINQLSELAQAGANFESFLLVGRAFGGLDLPHNLATKVRRFEQASEAKTYMQNLLISPQSRIYAKGSRSNRLESIFDLGQH